MRRNRGPKPKLYGLRRNAEKFRDELNRRFPDKKFLVVTDPMQSFKHAVAYNNNGRMAYASKLQGWRP
jgi:hypothetical protein